MKGRKGWPAKREKRDGVKMSGGEWGVGGGHM